MKTMKYYMGISFLAALLLFSGCGKGLDELPTGGSDTESPENPEQAEGELLRLRVSDAGYLDAGTGSRATDSGLKTTFEDGDKIGLFVVNNENEELYANVPYTKNGEKWTATQNVRTKGYPVRVFAYYPYVEDAEITGKVDASAVDASAFFKTYTDDLNINNQSTQELYRQADVMACMVTIDDAEAARKELTLKMNHLMGLVVVKLPEKVTLTSVNYYLKGDESYEWIAQNVTLPANLSEESLTVTGGIQPLKEETGYRYLCKSGENNISFSGGFMTYGATKSYTVSSATVSVGSSKTYNVSVTPFDAPGKAEYTLQVGDFYMKDGSILPSVTSSNKANCVGIVFWSGDPTATDPVLKAAHSGCTHGLVVSLKEAQSIQWQAKYENTTIQSWAASQSFYTSGGYKALNYNVSGGYNNPGEIQGYNNTEILKQYNSSHSSYPVTVLSCFNTITTGVNLPGGKTSGWYLPSPKELVELYNAKSKVNTSLSTLGSTPLSSSTYWSSGEYSSDYAWCVYLSNGYVSYYTKSNYYYVRLAFAF
ncbi:fimbrillin family protein [Phocaeicola plebeius]|uniref:fimbrillin family protein n=1 Tax=Phocaeicola plebeius TaxID=310297 RepID=UPI0026F28FFA|nr:DUF1566 domain-containing protein [Phocaeicola plebeius]MDD6913281.1 DUF1566 domain-containing protein [Phocaeicola plebeius]MDY5978085.1 DUF1566 domain-containing protein [Phocaeicola plebeius]